MVRGSSRIRAAWNSRRATRNLAPSSYRTSEPAPQRQHAIKTCAGDGGSVAHHTHPHATHHTQSLFIRFTRLPLRSLLACPHTYSSMSSLRSPSQMDMKGVKEASSSRTSVKFTSSDEGGEGGSPHSSLQREVVEETSREGWLKKKGTWSSWKDVYVVVRGGFMIEYKKEGVRSQDG